MNDGMAMVFVLTVSLIVGGWVLHGMATAPKVERNFYGVMFAGAALLLIIGAANQ